MPSGLRERAAEALDTIAAATKDRPEAAIKYASMVQSISNGWKNQQGQLEGFAKPTAVADKEPEEARLLAWNEADAGRNGGRSGLKFMWQIGVSGFGKSHFFDHFAAALVRW